jgi:hypothetical protein|tara:strand:+ start:442 stop:735 length:294 start_codon:yes stop_codon:yes gene_type:complete
MINETIMSIALFSVFATGYYTPLNVLTNWVTEKWINFTVRRQWFQLSKLALFLNCAKCQAFILGLIITHSLIDAIIASMLALIIKYIIEYVSKPESK